METEILRPNAAGDETNLFPSTPPNYACVDEASPDEDSTYVRSFASSYYQDLYNITDHSIGSGRIRSVKVYARAKVYSGTPDQANLKIALKSGATASESAGIWLTTSYDDYSNQWNEKPGGGAWGSDWSVIDALQVGVFLRRNTENSVNTQCTQVYVEVDCGAVQQAVGDGVITSAGNLSKSIFTKVGVGTGCIAITGAVAGRRVLVGLVGQGIMYIAGGLLPAKSFNRIVGQGTTSIIGALSTVKRMHWLVGQGTLRIKGVFRTTFDRVLKIVSISSTKNLVIICAPITGGHMSNFIAGETVICSLNVQDDEGGPRDPISGMKIKIVNPAGNVVVDEKDMSRDELGKYHYDYNSLPTDSRGVYEVQYTTIDGTRITIAKTTFTIE